MSETIANRRKALSLIAAGAPESKYNMRKPVFVEGWTIATDGHRLLGIQGDYCDGFTDEKFPKCRPWMDEPRNGVPVSASEFLEFIGPPVNHPECDECDGSGVIWRDCDYCNIPSHECPCRGCTDGKVVIQKQVTVGTAAIDANLASDVLPLIASETIGVEDRGAEQQLRIYGEDWLFILMPMRKANPERKFKLPAKATV